MLTKSQTVSLSEEKDLFIHKINSLLEYALDARVTNVLKSIELAEQAKKMSVDYDYQKGLADSLSHLGLFYMIIGQNDDASHYANEALIHYKKLNDKSGIAHALYTLGSVQYKEARHHVGLEKLLESLRHFQELEDLKGQSRTLKAIGFIYETFQEEQKALETYLECRRISNEIGDKNGESNACNPLSGLYLNRGEIEKSTEAIDTSIRLKQETGDKRGLAFALYGKGKILLFQKDFESAEKLFCSSLEKHEQVGERLGTAMCHIKLGALQFEKNEIKKSKDHFFDAIAVGEKMNNKEILYKAYFQLYRIADFQKNVQKALEYHVAYHENKSYVLNTGTRSRIKSLESMWKMESLENEAKAQRERNEIVQQKNDELDKFVSRVSHDLRGPISSMLGLYNLVVQEVKDPASLEYFSLYNNRLKRLNQTINDLLDLTKVNSLDILRTEIDFELLISDCLDAYKYYPHFSKIDFSIRIENTLEFRSDRRLIGAIIQNLVENSIKYCDKESKQPKVDISVKLASDDFICIIVEDNGIGIDQKYQPKVFDMFYRANDEIEGSGLGMYIVKNAVDKLEGEVKLTSELGIGSKFVVLLPIMD